MAEQNPEPIEVLILQFGQDANIDPILGKTLRVLPKPKLLEPVRNLLHWHHPPSGWRLAELNYHARATIKPINYHLRDVSDNHQDTLALATRTLCLPD